MKIRTGFVSNSSSSSFLICCSNESEANRILACYGECLDYFIKLNPNWIGYGLKKDKHSIVSIDKIKALLRYLNLKDWEYKYYMDSFIAESHKGYVFVLMTCDNEDGTPEHIVVESFIDQLESHNIQSSNGKEMDYYVAADFRRWI